MAKYKRVLLAVDLHEDNPQIVEKGAEIAAENGADLYLLHVFEPIAMSGYAMDGSGMLNDQLMSIASTIKNDARDRMARIAADIGVPDDRCAIAEGTAAYQIHKFIEDNDIDLLVMGTHGQSGWKLLLGSTANSVLHGIPCDSLIVRVNND